MTLTISPAVVAIVGTIILCVIGLRVYSAALRTVEHINAANNAATERMSKEYAEHVERMEMLRLKAADVTIRLKIAEAYRVDTQHAAQMILAGSVAPHLLN